MKTFEQLTKGLCRRGHHGIVGRRRDGAHRDRQQ